MNHQAIRFNSGKAKAEKWCTIRPYCKHSEMTCTWWLTALDEPSAQEVQVQSNGVGVRVRRHPSSSKIKNLGWERARFQMGTVKSMLLI